jgi:hypothetical protein
MEEARGLWFNFLHRRTNDLMYHITDTMHIYTTESKTDNTFLQTRHHTQIAVLQFLDVPHITPTGGKLASVMVVVE